MNQKRVLQGLLAVWASWNILNGLLATFTQQAGASLSGWAPGLGWTADLVSMSQQYGMVLLLLGGVYLITATDPVRYRQFVWVVVAEQLLGILYGAHATFILQQLTPSQFVTQVVINLVVAAVFLILRTGGSMSAGPNVVAKATEGRTG